MKFFTSIPFFVALLWVVNGQERYLTAVFKNGEEKNYTVETINELANDPSFNRNAKTVFYVYSILPESTSKYTQYQFGLPVVIEAYKKTPDNFIWVNFENYERDVLIETQMQTLEEDGKFLMESIASIVRAGANLDTLEIVGFQMGGQIAALAARSFSATYPVTIKTIIGLETALIPGFDSLKASDADFVMNMRIESRFSDEKVDGHVNFIFSNLTFPGCELTDLIYFYDQRCASERAQLIWAEAVQLNNPEAFLGKKCENLQSYSENSCEDDVNFFNPSVKRDLHGNFFAEINPAKEGPYNKDASLSEEL